MFLGFHHYLHERRYEYIGELIFLLTDNNRGKLILLLYHVLFMEAHLFTWHKCHMLICDL